MRNAFADEIEQLAAKDPMVVLLSGDIGNRLFDKFRARFPDRFYNCGVAEANMISMAAGLAMAGMRPVVYTIASFLIYRPYEQIRVDIGYHNLPVTLVGVGGGLSYASNGATHHACEDIAVMSTIPSFRIFNAGDTWEVRAGLNAALKSDTPFYLRIGKKREPVVHEAAVDFVSTPSAKLRDGSDYAIIASGNLLPAALQAAELASQHGIEASLHTMPFVSPLDETTLNSLFASDRKIAVIEEHSVQGGLGSKIIEWANLNRQDSGRITRIGAPTEFIKRTTTQEDMRNQLGLTPDAIAASILKHFKQS